MLRHAVGREQRPNAFTAVPTSANLGSNPSNSPHVRLPGRHPPGERPTTRPSEPPPAIAISIVFSLSVPAASARVSDIDGGAVSGVSGFKAVVLSSTLFFLFREADEA